MVLGANIAAALFDADCGSYRRAYRLYLRKQTYTVSMQITILLERLQQGERRALDELIPLVYDELKKLASGHLRRESTPTALGVTTLVHEAFLKLVNSQHPAYENRAHFYGIASKVMRQVLIDTARYRLAEKRAAGQEIAVPELPEPAPHPDRCVLVMNDALKELEKADPVKAELIEMRYFGGFTAEEISTALSKPVHIVRRELRLAKAWLRMRMEGIYTY